MASSCSFSRSVAPPQVLIPGIRAVYNVSMCSTPSNKARISVRMRAAAKQHGFHAVGVASAESVLEFARRDGLRGYHFDLQTALPGAKSAICAALSYLSNAECGVRNAESSHSPSTINHQPSTRTGVVARFARGTDYHTVMESRLEGLARRLHEEFGDFRHRICVDTGPISDRACAYAAGLGSFGKNTCIITPEYGSWVVLGELVTDLELEPDKPREMEICGDCRLCVEACPTGALRGDFTIDGARCLSDVTQRKKPPTPELAARLGNRVYGCDTCQEVCPLSANAKRTDVPEFLSENPVGAHPDLAMLAEMTDEDFERLFGDTAMHWVGRETIARNARLILTYHEDTKAQKTR